MVRLADAARVTGAPDNLTSDVQRNSWLLWQSVAGQCQRRHAEVTADGYYVYRGTLRSHVNKLWPMLESEERRSFEREIYAFLNQAGVARCIQKKDPVVWHVAVTWHPENVVVPLVRFRQSRAERRLTPHEAGEDREPLPVTTRKIEEPMPPINPKVEEAFREQHRKRAEDTLARRALIAEFVQESVSEPVVVDEVAHQFDVNSTTARTDLQTLVSEGVLFTRDETREERSIRYGGSAYAKAAALYWGKPDIPARTKREVVEGFVMQTSPSRDSNMSSMEINRRMWLKLKRKTPRSRFTVADIANTSLNLEVTRARMRKMVAAGVLTRTSKRQGTQHVYKIVDLEAVREFLGQPAQDVIDPEPAPPPVPVATSPVSNYAARVKQVLDDNEKLRKQVEALRAERQAALDAAANLRNELFKLRQQMQSGLDDDTASRLAAWSPSE